ncbi:MAG TPA: shikimate dehydrogenase [Streptosporangiaceae bacterium]|jgi:shikimate dehydrogenase
MKAAVLGSPIAHSLSPALHRAAYAALGLPGWSYRAIECDEAGLPELLASCGDGWAGLSLTMPLKRAVLGLADWLDPVATATGSANTIVFDGGARGGPAFRRGYNTDVAGMVTALTETGLDGPPPETLILGGGATACSALAALRELGIDRAEVAVRDRGGADGLLAAAARLGVSTGLRAFGKIPDHGPELLISTVPAGGADFYAERFQLFSPAPRLVFDVVYHPWPTALAAAAAAAGAVTVGGFELLLHQAARQVQLMTGRQAPVAQMRAAGQAELAARAT